MCIGLRTVNDGGRHNLSQTKVMVPDGDFLDYPAAEVGDAAVYHGSKLRRRDL